MIISEFISEILTHSKGQCNERLEQFSFYSFEYLKTFKIPKLIIYAAIKYSKQWYVFVHVKHPEMEKTLMDWNKLKLQVMG